MSPGLRVVLFLELCAYYNTQIRTIYSRARTKQGRGLIEEIRYAYIHIPHQLGICTPLIVSQSLRLLTNNSDNNLKVEIYNYTKGRAFVSSSFN